MKILLAIDGSRCSEAALQSLIKQYKAENTEVLVLHAVESLKLMPIPQGFGVGPIFVEDYLTLVQKWREEGEALVSVASERLHSAGFKTTTQVEDGDARQVILECAKKWQPDIIMLGSHGKRGLDRLLLGSVSDAVSRHAACSVEIVRTAVAPA